MVVFAGVLRQITGSWKAYLWTLTVLAVLALLAAYQVSKMRSVDSELGVPSSSSG